jgi:hypothetical protein
VSPYVIGGSVLASLALAGVTGWKGYRLGQDNVIAQQAKQEKLVREVRDAALQGAAEEIAKLRITHTTIRQRAEKEIIREPIYTECAHPEPMRRLLDAALTQSPLPESIDRSELSETDAPR